MPLPGLAWAVVSISPLPGWGVGGLFARELEGQVDPVLSDSGRRTPQPVQMTPFVERV